MKKLWDGGSGDPAAGRSRMPGQSRHRGRDAKRGDADVSAGGVPLSRLAIALFVLDIVGFVALLNISHWIELEKFLGVTYLPLYGVLLLQLLILYVLDLYSIDAQTTHFDILARTAFAVVFAGLVVAGIVYITKASDTESFFFRGVLSTGFVLFLVWAAVIRYVASDWIRKFASKVRWLVVSDVEPNSPVCRDIAAVRKTGKMTVLLANRERADELPREITENVAGSFAAFDEMAARRWSGIIIAVEKKMPEELLRRIMEMRLSGVRIYDLTDFYEQLLQKVPILHLRDNWFALSHGFDLLHHSVQLKVKRILDIVLACVILILASPVMLLVAIAIKLDRRGNSKGPVLYHQLRTGANGSEFYMHKFRTMVRDAEAQGPQWAQHNDSRVTRVGRFLRKSRLDELPQLWNVLKGEKSFIGPRPERPDFNKKLEQAIPYYDLRHLIKPGITGWAQVKYNYGSSTEEALEKLQYDIYYIKNYSLLLDLFIALKTLRVIVSQRGR